VCNEQTTLKTPYQDTNAILEIKSCIWK